MLNCPSGSRLKLSAHDLKALDLRGGWAMKVGAEELADRQNTATSRPSPERFGLSCLPAVSADRGRILPGSLWLDRGALILLHRGNDR